MPSRKMSGQKPERALQHMYFPIGRDSYDLEDVGIDRHHSYYYPPSALHEPFASLFAKKPEAALGLCAISPTTRRRAGIRFTVLTADALGTPIPVILEFPWGEQQFWGDWYVYNWFMGQLAPQPLECAFLALSHFGPSSRSRSAGRPMKSFGRWSKGMNATRPRFGAGPCARDL